jgi:hypothetical protein
MKRACLLFTIAACASEPTTIDYTGETQRFVIDSIMVPKNNSEAREFGFDIDQDRTIDNQLGMAIGTLASFKDITSHGPDMIASGALASSIEIIADDFNNDTSVALHYFGSDRARAELVGGRLHDGAFETTVSTGMAIVHLPVFVDADPIAVRLTHMRVELVPDGRGGFDARIGGAIGAEEARRAALVGIKQMITARPHEHVLMTRMIDEQPHDFEITQEEFDRNSLIKSLMSPDLTIDRVKLVSIGFRAHLSPCSDGRCVTAPPAAPCFDRVKNGDETDVDCGGSCGVCAAGAACTEPSDCESGSCSGTCAAPTCTDGVRDGHETDVDCGGLCGGCRVNQLCWGNADCASRQCGEPCTGTFCGEYSEDVCR